MASSTEHSVSFNLSPSSSSSSTSPCSFRSPPSTLHFSQFTNKSSLTLSSSDILSGFGHPHPLTVVYAKGYKVKTHKLEIRCRKMKNSKNMSLDASGASENVSLLNCIDLSSPDIHSSVSLLKQACLDSGFFYVINHGISQEFMDEVFYQSKRFFDLPIIEKMKLLRNEKHRGYTPVLDEYLDPAEQKHGDFKEGYYIGVEVPDNDPDWHKPFYGPNVWPTADILPGWRETMEKYHREAFEVAKAIARIIALALDLEVDYFDQQETLGKPIATLRLLHYEGRISDPAEGIFGAGAHSDFGFITLLATDDNHGLQICKDKDAKPQQWEFVAPLRGALIVNLADLLERWSNCIFRSTLHRVLGNGQDRYSIAYFADPNHDCLVECLPTCQSQENPPKFPPIKCETYMLQRYKDTHARYKDIPADPNSYNK